MTAQIVDPTRQRCRGDAHRPGCSHIGNDPTRQRCSPDLIRHRPGCRHLNQQPSRPVGRPRKAPRLRAQNPSRSEAQKARRRRERDKMAQPCMPLFGGVALGPTGAETNARLSVETSPLRWPNRGTAGPKMPLPPGSQWPTCPTCATVEVTHGSKLSNGYPSGVGVTSAYRSAHLIDGRRREPFGPAFASPAELNRFLDNHDCAWPEPAPDWTDPVYPAGSIHGPRFGELGHIIMAEAA